MQALKREKSTHVHLVFGNWNTKKIVKNIRTFIVSYWKVRNGLGRVEHFWISSKVFSINFSVVQSRSTSLRTKNLMLRCSKDRISRTVRVTKFSGTFSGTKSSGTFSKRFPAAVAITLQKSWTEKKNSQLKHRW